MNATLKPQFVLTYNLPQAQHLKPFWRQNQIFTPCLMKGPRYNEISKLILIWIIHMLKPWLSCHSGLIAESALENTKKKTNKMLREKRTREHRELVSVRSSLIRNSHFPSIQPLHTPWWRLRSNNLLLGRALRLLWLWLKFLGTGGSLWKALKKGCQKAVWNMVKLLVGHFRQVLCRYPCLRCSNSYVEHSLRTKKIVGLPLPVNALFRICTSLSFMSFFLNIFNP